MKATERSGLSDRGEQPLERLPKRTAFLEIPGIERPLNYRIARLLKQLDHTRELSFQTL